jgi:hypothetical protein
MTTNELLTCPKCEASISQIAEICPHCLVQIDHSSNTKLSAGEKVAIAIGVAAVAAGSPMAIISALSVPVSLASALVKRNAAKSINKKIEAIDFIVFNDNFDEVAITHNEFIWVLFTAGLSTVVSRVPRRTVSNAFIDEQYSSKQLFGGETVRISLNLKTGKESPVGLTFKGKTARVSANAAVAKINLYVLGME